MSDLKETLSVYVKRVRDLAEHVKGNEQATKQSLIGPLFTALGYDMTDPRECVPEHRENFGLNRSKYPIDWLFQQDGNPIFIVEAKEAGRRLAGYDEQLADYFAKKQPNLKLGILTNGVQWKFFTDYSAPNVMDREPFVKWDIMSDEAIPLDFLTLLQKSQFDARLIRTFAQRNFQQNLLLAELTRLLEPSNEFVRLAISNIETRTLRDNVVESWKPVLANAIEEWTKQKMLTMVISGATQPQASDATAVRKINTTREELDGFEAIKKMLGNERPVSYTDTVSYFKIHLPDRHTWVVCRLYFEGKRPRIWMPVPIARVEQWLSPFKVTFPQIGWICITLDSHSDLEKLGDIIRAAYDHQKSERLAHPDDKLDSDEQQEEGLMDDSSRPEPGTQ
jgi:hypothetical protein